MRNKRVYCLFLVLALGLGFRGCCPTPNVLPCLIERDSDQLVAATQQLVQIPSVQSDAEEGAPAGPDVAEALDAALAICEDLGFETVNLDGYVGYAEYGTGDEYVAVLGHLDVVSEGDADEWTYPPYSGEIHDGVIWGRGTQDDKGPMMAALFGLKAIKDSGLHLSKRVRIIFGTMEEESGPDVEHYLETEADPVQGFTPDAYFPVVYAEKGLIRFDLANSSLGAQTGDPVITSITGGSAINAVPDEAHAILTSSNAAAIVTACTEFATETGYEISAAADGTTIDVTSLGVSVHSMHPETGQNAIMQLLGFLGSLDLPDSDIADVIDFMNTYIGMTTDGAAMLGEAYTTDAGSLTMSVDLATVDTTSATFSVDLRYPYGVDGDTQIREPIATLLAGSGTGLTYTEWAGASEPLYYDPDDEFITTLLHIYQSETGDTTTEPLAIGGKSYAQELPNTVAYGALFPDETELFHMVDENVAINDLISAAKIYARAIYELAK